MGSVGTYSSALTGRKEASMLPTPTNSTLTLHPHFLKAQLTWRLCDLFQDTIEITGTFKHRKVTLMEEGFNPTVIKDTLYFMDDAEKTFVPMTENIYNAIIDKTLKL
jgi:hypothetical protein